MLIIQLTFFLLFYGNYVYKCSESFFFVRTMWSFLMNSILTGYHIMYMSHERHFLSIFCSNNIDIPLERHLTLILIYDIKNVAFRKAVFSSFSTPEPWTIFFESDFFNVMFSTRKKIPYHALCCLASVSSLPRFLFDTLTTASFKSNSWNRLWIYT